VTQGDKSTRELTITLTGTEWVAIINVLLRPDLANPGTSRALAAAIQSQADQMP
jgi:hypothetical protein